MNFEQFLSKVAADKSLAEKLEKSGSPTEAFDIAKEAGLDVTMEEFMDSMNKVHESCSEMSQADVDSIVGGVDATTSVKISAAAVGGGATVTATVASAAGAAV